MDVVNVRIRELRVEHGFTQQYVADLLGIDRSNYSKDERGLLSVTPICWSRSQNFTT